MAEISSSNNNQKNEKNNDNFSFVNPSKNSSNSRIEYYSNLGNTNLDQQENSSVESEKDLYFKQKSRIMNNTIKESEEYFRTLSYLNIQPDSNLDSELNNNTIPESDGLNHFDSLLMNQNSEDNSQYKEIEEAFLAFDKECEGAIPTYKLATVMRTLGQNPTKEELEDIIKEYDKDENGTIDLSEFKTLMINKLKEQESSEILIQIFKMFDKNDDGFIDFSDIKYILESIDYDFEEPNLESIIKAMIRKAGKNINDQMNFQEFKRILLGTNNKENLNEK